LTTIIAQCRVIASILISGIILFALSNNAHAQAYFRVADLEDDDHLNVRAEPSSGSEDLGDLASGSQPHEILEADSTGKWGKILWLEGHAWVALEFMQPIDIEQLADTTIPVGLTCVGAEPFWTIEFKSQKIALLSTPDNVIPMTVEETEISANRTSYPVAVKLETDTFSSTAILERAACSDGMGDISYGWSTNVLMQPKLQLLSGCCVLR